MDVDDRGLELLAGNQSQGARNVLGSPDDLPVERVKISFEHDGNERVIFDDQNSAFHDRGLASSVGAAMHAVTKISLAKPSLEAAMLRDQKPLA
jgi:hypothetical protein